MIEQPIDPPESLTDNPTSDEIADMVLSGDIDMSKWRKVTPAMRSDAFLDIIGILSSTEYDTLLTARENSSELLNLILDGIRKDIQYWAELETYGREAGMRTLL